MTSLSRQLSRLRVPQTSTHREKKGSVSFLYDFLEAKSIDNETYFAIASSGLQSLIQLDPSIERFKETIFNESSKTLDRALHSSEANQELDEEIESFLFGVVSKYFLLNSTHKTIEWLIHRYGVNQYNVDSLIACVLPYHETRLFARLLQTCSAPKDETSDWFWLKPIQKNGCPLSKSTLITHCISEPSFLRFICDNIIKCLKIDSNCNNFLTFYVSTLINVTEKTTHESIIAIIVPIFITGLKSKNELFRKASLCVCGHFCSRIQLEQKIVNRILRAIGKRFSNSMSAEILLTLSIMDRFQQIEDLPSNLLNSISGTDLIKCHQKYEIQNLISLVLKCLLKDFVSFESNEKLMTLLDETNLTSAAVDTCVHTISDLIKANGNEIPSEMFSKVLSLLELRYPLLLDSSLSKLKSLSSIAPYLDAFRYSHLKTSQMPLIFGLTHVSQSVQTEAIDYLIENFDVLVSTRDEMTINTIRTLLSEVFAVKSPQILITIFGLKEKMFKIFSEEEMRDICQNLLVLCHQKEKSVEEGDAKSWHQMKNSILATYCSMSSDYNESLNSILYQFLMPLNESDLITLSIILNSNIAKENEIFVKLIDNCKQMIESDVKHKDIDSIVISICNEIAKYYIENPNLIHKNVFVFIPQTVDYLKSSILSLIVLERMHFLSSDPSIKQKTAIILLTLLEILLKSQKISKPKKTVETFEAFVTNGLKNLRRNQLNLSIIIYVFESVIKTIDLPKKSSPETNVWFWFKQFNSDHYFYKLFGLLFNNCYNNNENKSNAFRNTFRDFVQKIFKRIGYNFFGPLWTYDKSLLLQSRSLTVCSYFKKSVKSVNSLTILSLLIALHSPLSSSRESILEIMNHLSQQMSKSVESSSNGSALDDERQLNHRLKKSLLNHCLENSEIIKSDNNAISDAIAKWFSSSPETKSIFNDWINLLDDDNCPQHFKSGIVVLLNRCESDSIRELLSKMINYSNINSPNSCQMKTIECLLSIYGNSNIFQHLNSETDIIFEFFFNCLKLKSIKQMAINSIDRTLFDGISSQNLKIKLLNELLDICVNNSERSCHKKLKKIVKCGHLISDLLMNLVPIDENNSSEPKPKRRLFNNSEFSPESNNWKKFMVLLEIIQSKSHLTNISVLSENLFNYLNNTFIMTSKSSLEYLRQLLLNSLINCMKQSDEDLAVSQIDPVIECLRESQQKETQKLALILISSVAHRFKKEILDSVITIFTFIGTNLLHCDDQYSIQIVFDTMEAILPICLSDTNETKDKVIDVFINSLLDIAAHRRLVLFHKLLEMLGENQNLTIIFIKVIEKVFNKTKLEKEPFLALIVALSSKCQLNTQIKSINELMDVLSNEFVEQKKSVSTFDKSYSESDRKLLSQSISQLILRLISSQEFIDSAKNTEWTQISDDLLSFLHRVIVLMVEFNQSKPSAEDLDHNRRRIRYNLNQILFQFNSLLPNKQFIELVVELIKNDSTSIQRKAFELLHEKLPKLQEQSLDTKQLRDLLKCLTSMVPTSESANQMDEQHIYICQLSLIACKMLSKLIGDEDKFKNKISDLLKKLISLTTGLKPEISANFKASCVITMTQLMIALTIKAIPFIPSVVPIILKNIETNDELIIIANLSPISKLTQNYPQFFSPYLHQILVKLLNAYKKFPRIKSRLNTVWVTFAKVIPKLNIITAIDSSFDEISKISAESMTELMSLLKKTFENLSSKSDVNSIQKFVKSLLTKAIDLRNSNRNKMDSQNICEIENSCNEAFSVFIPKLTEVTFRPLFFKLYDCAIREKSGKSYYRMISFYRLMNVLAHKLKSLFCIFVGSSIVNNCSQMLTLFHSDNESELTLNPEDSNLLIVSILSTLSNCFLYDINGGFFNKDRMEALSKPIIDQLSNTLGTEEHYNQRIESLCLCTQYLIESNREETVIKHFNYQILLKTRDSTTQIRLAALRVLRRLIMVSGEDYLPIIPETIPFISELSEDDSNAVEDLVKTVITDLEQTMGEPITKYL